MEMFTDIMYMMATWAMGICTGMGIGTSIAYQRCERYYREAEQV